MQNLRFSVVADDIRVGTSSSGGLLDLLEGKGLVMAGCREGSCGMCQVRVVKGQVDGLDTMHALSDRDKQAGYILPCTSTVKTNLILEL